MVVEREQGSGRERLDRVSLFSAMSQVSWMRVGGKGTGLHTWSAVPGKLQGFWNRRKWQTIMQRRQVSDGADVVVKIPLDRKLPTDPIERKAAVLVSPHKKMCLISLPL